MGQSWDTVTSVSAGHIILTPTQPVGSGRPQWESTPGPPHQELRALPTELPRLEQGTWLIEWLILWNNKIMYLINAQYKISLLNLTYAAFLIDCWNCEFVYRWRPFCCHRLLGRLHQALTGITITCVDWGLALITNRNVQWNKESGHLFFPTISCFFDDTFCLKLRAVVWQGVFTICCPSYLEDWYNSMVKVEYQVTSNWSNQYR